MIIITSYSFSQASSSTRTWLDELRCLGTESRLINCPANSIGDEDCSHLEDISLVCAANGDLRLIGSSGLTGGSSGRLEVYYSGQWGTVCDDSFSPNDARVACRQLGFSTYSRYGAVGALGWVCILILAIVTCIKSPILKKCITLLYTASLMKCIGANLQRNIFRRHLRRFIISNCFLRMLSMIILESLIHKNCKTV